MSFFADDSSSLWGSWLNAHDLWQFVIVHLDDVGQAHRPFEHLLRVVVLAQIDVEYL